MKKEAEKEIRSLVELWKNRIGLNDWIVNVSFEYRGHPDEEGCEADIEAFTHYREADLTIWNGFWKFGKEHRIINLIHELVHLILWKLHPHLSPSGDDVLEEVCQQTAVAIYRAWTR